MGKRRRKKTIDVDHDCACGTGRSFAECCGQYLSGEAEAPTAEALMRSRFTAYATDDSDYLTRTWHPDTRPPVLELDRNLRWNRLEMGATQAGRSLDATGLVEFAAHYSTADGTGVLRELSRFVRHHGRWVYVDGTAVEGE